MSPTMSFSGRCLCGAVTYEANAAPVFSGNCYCTDCQRESGGGHLTITTVPDAAVKISGPTSTFSKPGASGLMIERTFCSKCGSTLFGRPQAMAGMTMLRAGTLDEPSKVVPSMSIYISRAHAWDQPSSDIPGHSEMPARP